MGKNTLECLVSFFVDISDSANPTESFFFTRLFKLMKIYFVRRNKFGEFWVCVCNFAVVLCDDAAMLRRRWNFYWWWDTPAILLALNSRTEIRIHDFFLCVFFGRQRQIVYSCVISHANTHTDTANESHLCSMYGHQQQQQQQSLQLPYGLLLYKACGVCMYLCSRRTMHDVHRLNVMCVGSCVPRDVVPFWCLLILTIPEKRNPNAVPVPFGARTRVFVHVLSCCESIYSTTNDDTTHSAEHNTHKQIFIDNNSSRESICVRSFAMFYCIFFFCFSLWVKFFPSCCSTFSLIIPIEKKGTSICFFDVVDEITIYTRCVRMNQFIYPKNDDVFMHDEILSVSILLFNFWFASAKLIFFHEYFTWTRCEERYVVKQKQHMTLVISSKSKKKNVFLRLFLCFSVSNNVSCEHDDVKLSTAVWSVVKTHWWFCFEFKLKHAAGARTVHKLNAKETLE